LREIGYSPDFLGMISSSGHGNVGSKKTDHRQGAIGTFVDHFKCAH
jgi:hypothetical protein